MSDSYDFGLSDDAIETGLKHLEKAVQALSGVIQQLHDEAVLRFHHMSVHYTSTDKWVVQIIVQDVASWDLYAVGGKGATPHAAAYVCLLAIRSGNLTEWPNFVSDPKFSKKGPPIDENPKKA